MNAAIQMRSEASKKEVIPVFVVGIIWLVLGASMLTTGDATGTAMVFIIFGIVFMMMGGDNRR